MRSVRLTPRHVNLEGDRRGGWRHTDDRPTAPENVEFSTDRLGSVREQHRNFHDGGVPRIYDEVINSLEFARWYLRRKRRHDDRQGHPHPETFEGVVLAPSDGEGSAQSDEDERNWEIRSAYPWSAASGVRNDLEQPDDLRGRRSDRTPCEPPPRPILSIHASG